MEKIIRLLKLLRGMIYCQMSSSSILVRDFYIAFQPVLYSILYDDIATYEDPPAIQVNPIS